MSDILKTVNQALPLKVIDTWKMNKKPVRESMEPDVRGIRFLMGPSTVKWLLQQERRQFAKPKIERKRRKLVFEVDGKRGTVEIEEIETYTPISESRAKMYRVLAIRYAGRHIPCIMRPMTIEELTEFLGGVKLIEKQ